MLQGGLGTPEQIHFPSRFLRGPPAQPPNALVRCFPKRPMSPCWVQMFRLSFASRVAAQTVTDKPPTINTVPISP